MTLAEDQFALLRGSVVATLKRGVSTREVDWAPIQNGLEELIENTYDTAINVYSEELLSKFLPLYKKAMIEITNSEFDKHKPLAKLKDLPELKIEKLDIQTLITRAGGAAGAIKSLVDMIKLASKEAAGQGVRQTTATIAVETIETTIEKGAAEAGSNIIEAGAKQGGEAAARALGPIIMAAAAAWEIWRGFKQAEKEKLQVEKALNEVTCKGDLVTANAKQLFIKDAAKMRRSFVIPLNDHLRQRMLHISKSNTEIKGQLNNLSKVRSQINIARENISHETAN